MINMDSNPQKIINLIQNTTDLRQLKLDLLKSKYKSHQRLPQKQLQDTHQEMDTKKFLQQKQEWFMNKSENERIQQQMQLQVEQQMRQQYQNIASTLKQQVQKKQKQIEEIHGNRKQLQAKKLAVLDTVKQAQQNLILLKKSLKTKQIKLQQTNYLELINPNTLQLNQKIIAHLHERIQANKSQINKVRLQIQKKIRKNQYLDNALFNKNKMEAQLQDINKQMIMLTNQIRERKSETIKYVRQCENDINNIVEKQLGRALDAKLTNKYNYKAAYQQLYKIISEQVMENGKYNLFNIIGQINEEEHQ